MDGKMELFVEQPNIEIKAGIRVTKDTVIKYKNKNVEQTVENLMMETLLKDNGTNGVNTYESESRIKIHFVGGEILLFDETRGYYMPPYPMSTIEDAICDMESLKGLNFEK